MSLPPSSSAAALPPRSGAGALQSFVLGWAAGAALTLLVRALGGALLSGPCEGYTLLALLPPLLLGPGGLGFTATQWRSPRRAALGLGLVTASLVPALFVGVQDIGRLRGNGCAGGYIVFTGQSAAEAQQAVRQQKSVSTLSLVSGSTQNLTGRLGGYRTQEYPEPFFLSARSSAPGVRVTLPRTRVRAGETFPVRVQAVPGTGANTYTVAITARGTQGEREVTATGNLDITVRRATP
ncbi:hypothetical protein DEDE109153_11695 [Deinococcus deserti]|uniref:Uncharacterized protein n=1 Tax=Deinococcus deserti (strain DSM 17065 / CIP 109153 / LMG 22923 / VCD115) TaxID=546414 RepID=C1CXZ3_DEIDV|nr:hypothetical protein [Deinococcus deserti]ACO46949.1 hypothetical protein Deide_19481 [Deinococcus deserti VCD115]